jgi:hypothetical protein
LPATCSKDFQAEPLKITIRYVRPEYQTIQNMEEQVPGFLKFLGNLQNTISTTIPRVLQQNVREKKK